MSDGPVAGSFRDPSGFVFTTGGEIYRQINRVYRKHYELLMSCGLYDRLTGDRLLIPHEVASVPAPDPELAYRVIKPEQIPWISYPYEWSFSQLKDAALITLRIQQTAMQHQMSLKDCSAYNVQFFGGRAVFIDTLSFEPYREGEPWVAYRQFCEHFLAPLALMHYRDIRLLSLLRTNIDGIPIDLASTLMPRRTLFDLALLSHLHLHAKAQKRYAGDNKPRTSASRHGVTRMGLLGVLDNLRTCVERLRWRAEGTEWGEYYSDTNYDDEAMDRKREIVSEFVSTANPLTVWDLGANTGVFSRLASKSGAYTVAFDIDPAAVERNYLAARQTNDDRVLPLVLDLTNPSPGLGWHHAERLSLIQRGPADLAMALALIHHLAISNNLPLTHIAAFLAEICSYLIIEFVPKTDSQVQRLLARREDIFPGYTRDGFERAFRAFFEVVAERPVLGSERHMYLMRRLRV